MKDRAGHPASPSASPGNRFRFPGGDSRTTVLGMTGSGKTTGGAWLLAHQRFDARPWIIFDYKREQLFDFVGFPPIKAIDLDSEVPRKKGLYLVSPIAKRDDDAVEAMLWRIWQRGNCGIFVDEAYLMPDKDAFPAIYQQGRSLRIPVIACSQRPVSVPRPLFSEADFMMVYELADKRDYAIVQGFVPADLSTPLPMHHFWYYDRKQRSLLHMAAVPPPAHVARLIDAALPRPAPSGWHPWVATAKTSSQRLN